MDCCPRDRSCPGRGGGGTKELSGAPASPTRCHHPLGHWVTALAMFCVFSRCLSHLCVLKDSQTAGPKECCLIKWRGRRFWKLTDWCFPASQPASHSATYPPTHPSCTCHCSPRPPITAPAHSCLHRPPTNPNHPAGVCLSACPVPGPVLGAGDQSS